MQRTQGRGRKKRDEYEEGNREKKKWWIKK